MHTRYFEGKIALTTLVDRMLRKIGWLPAAAKFTPALPAKQSSIRSIEDLKNVPRYPPFMEGLPVFSPTDLLFTQRELIQSIHHLIADKLLLCEHYDPAISRLTSFVHLLPASQAHHHRGAGGLLRHSLEVGFWALQQTEGKLIRGITTPQQRRVFEPRWRLAVFLAGICHDLGKVVTDLTVTDRANENKWRPYKQSLYEWAESNAIESYFLHWIEGRAKNHTNVSSTLIETVIGKATFDWISEGSTDAVIWMTESLNNNPGQSNQIHNFVVKADQVSVERDLRSMGAAMAGYEIGVPIERYLTDIMRRMVQEGVWRINEAGARIWNINDNTYLVWPMAGEEVARRTRDEDIPGLPKTSDGILDMMVERGIILMREGEGDPCFYIAPDVLTEKIPNLKLKCVRLRDQALISTMPIPAVPGKIVNETHGAEEVTCEKAKNDHSPDDQESDLNTEAKTKPKTKPKPVVAPQVSVGVVEAAKAEMPEPVTTSQQIQQVLNLNEINQIPPKVNATSQKSDGVADDTPKMTMKQLTGSMGELLKVLIDDFQTGKKSLSAMTITQDHYLYLMWPHSFTGYGFTPKQILDGLTERGWMIPMSDAAKVGECLFADGVAKAIRLTLPVSRLFPQPEKSTPPTILCETIPCSPPYIDEAPTRSHERSNPPVKEQTPVAETLAVSESSTTTAKPAKRAKKPKVKKETMTNISPVVVPVPACVTTSHTRREIFTKHAQIPRKSRIEKK